MASLRDVFDHAGRRVHVLSDGRLRAEGKAMQRGNILLLEAKLEPRIGETLLLVDAGLGFRVVQVEPQFHGERVDHYRVRGEPLRG